MTLQWPDSATLSRLDAVLSAPRGRRVGLLGLGISGRAMAKYLERRGALVVAADQKLDLDRRELKGLELRLGNPGPETFADVEALCLSPGADPRQAAVQCVLERGVPVFGELELVGALPAVVAGITGTNGKSTTTALLGHLVASTGRPTFTGGNLGDPIAAWVDGGARADFAVLELSSYQLESAYRFRPRVAVVLNVTPDHAERYPTIVEYALAKRHLVEQLGPEDIAVLNADDERVSEMAGHTHGQLWWLSTRRAELVGDAAWLSGDLIKARGACAVLDGIDLAHPRLFGRHNRENALAAWLGAHALGLVSRASLPALHRAYLEFRGLEHRLELAGEVGGVRYVNDSKATNDDSAAVAVGAMSQPVVLLAGGVDKGGGYAGLVAAAAGKVRVVVVYGQAKDKLAAAFTGHPGLVTAKSMAEAFVVASREARPGEVVLLAPACSSFDEFQNYAERGRTFKRQVQELARGGQ